MKKTSTFLALFAAVGILLTACGKKQSTQELTKAVSYEDTVGFSEFQNWKAQNERAEYEEYQRFKNGEMPQQQTPAAAAVAFKSTAPRRTSSGTSAPVAQQPAQKKGWSKAAKGTVIGAGSGAVIGAVVNKKNRGLGAVIGGVIGGGVGYGIGRNEDRKDGRVR